MNSTRLLLFAMWLACGTHIYAQGTSIDLSKDGRIIAAERASFLKNCVKAPPEQNKPTFQMRLSDDLRRKLAGINIIAIAVPERKIDKKYIIGLIIGYSTLPVDWSVTETDFKILRDYSRNQNLSAVEEKYRAIQEARSNQETELQTNELQQIIDGAKAESEITGLYAGYLLAPEADKSGDAPYSGLTKNYRMTFERSLDPYISISVKRQELAWATPFNFSAEDDPFTLSDLQGYRVYQDSHGYLKVWRGRSLVIIAEKPGAPFSANQYKGGLVEYVAKENSTLTGSSTVIAANIPFHRWSSPNDLTHAVETLETLAKKMPEFFSAPSPQLQSDFFRDNVRPPPCIGCLRENKSLEDTLSTLYAHRQGLQESALERAAILAFALEDYQWATDFVDTGLTASPRNKQLLAARGLIQYEQSLYPEALASLQLARPSAPTTNSNFAAALIGNEGLVQWGLGQTRNAETSLSNSRTLFRGDAGKQQQAYFLLAQADFYADYGQPARALELSEQALNLVGTSSSDEQARIVAGRVHRLKAKVALFRGIVNEAKQEIEKAIKVHQNESSFLELAQNKDVQSDIEEQTGMHVEALKTLQEAAALYKDSKHIKGRSENQWKRANVLLALNRFDDSERLIDDASLGFAQLNYKRGLGDCEALRGVLILRRANHQYVMHFDPNMTPEEKQALDKEFRSQAWPGIERFETAIRIFQEISYRRGLAYAQDKLAINIISLNQQLSGEDFSRAELNSKQAARIFEEIGDKRGQAVAYGNLGIVLRKNKQYELAQSNLESALEISKEIGFKLGIGRQLYNLGRVYYEKAFSEKREEELLHAKNYFLEAQKVFKETQAGADELKAIDDYLKNLAEILR